MIPRSLSMASVLLLGLALMRFAYLGLYQGFKPGGGEVDFRPCYVAGRMALARVNPYDVQAALPYARDLTDWHEKDAYPFLYPPPSLLLYSPLSLLPFKAAAKVWGLISLAALVFLLRMGSRCLGDEPAAVVAWISVCLALPAAGNTLGLGQMNLLVLCCMVGTTLAVIRSDQTRAGLWLAAAIALKLTPLLFLLYFAVRGYWRACLVTVSAVGGLLLAAWLAFPQGTLRAWMAGLSAFEPFGRTWITNQSPTGLLQTLGMHGWTAPLCLILLGLTIAAWRRIPHPLLGFGLAAVTMLLVSPFSLPHHYVILALPLAALISMWHVLPPGRQTLAAACFGGFALQYNFLNPAEAVPPGVLKTLLGYPLVFWALVLWGLMMALSLQPVKSPARST